MARDIHAVMIPWFAFGHLIPFFNLSIALAKAGVRVSFVSTPRNIQRLPKVLPGLETLIHMVEFPLPILDEQLLPEGSEATMDVPPEKVQYLMMAYDLLQNPVKQFVADQRPDWIFIDFISYWVDEIAKDLKIPLLMYRVFAASQLAFMGHPECLVGEGQKRTRPSPESLTSPPEWGEFPSSVAYRSFEATTYYQGFYGQNASGISVAERLAKGIQACKALATRSCNEYEGEYFNICEKIIGKPVIPIGLILPEKPAEGRRSITDKSWIEIFEWLDLQKPNSVVFVAFGSESRLSKEQVHELAHGLELSGLIFLWALRKPDWATINDPAIILPSGFHDRTHGRGFVSIAWAPQLEILEHPSVGGFLSHAGWGSITETMPFGHCLVVLPLGIDQPLNARVLVEKGLAIEIERNEDGSFNRDAIAKALRLAMVSEKGQNLRVRAREAAQIFGNRELQCSYFDRFVEYLKKNGAENY